MAPHISSAQVAARPKSRTAAIIAIKNINITLSPYNTQKHRHNRCKYGDDNQRCYRQQCKTDNYFKHFLLPP